MDEHRQGCDNEEQKARKIKRLEAGMDRSSEDATPGEADRRQRIFQEGPKAGQEEKKSHQKVGQPCLEDGHTFLRWGYQKLLPSPFLRPFYRSWKIPGLSGSEKFCSGRGRAESCRTLDESSEKKGDDDCLDAWVRRYQKHALPDGGYGSTLLEKMKKENGAQDDVQDGPGRDQAAYRGSRDLDYGYVPDKERQE